MKRGLVVLAGLVGVLAAWGEVAPRVCRARRPEPGALAARVRAGGVPVRAAVSLNESPCRVSTRPPSAA